MGICLDTEQNNEEVETTGGAQSRRDSTWVGRATPPAAAFPMQNSSHVKFEPPSVPVIFILGGPGSGKVTHCDNLMQERRGLVHVNMTDLLQQYAIGNDMQDFGTLSSKTVTEVLMLEMKMAPTAKTYLVSGYPRSMRDVAEYSDKIQTISGVVLVSWRQRVLERQIEYGARLGHVVLSLARMELTNFYRSVMPVAEYFDQSGMLIAVNGERNPEEVYKDFRAAVLQILGSVEDQSTMNGVSGVGVGAGGIPGEIVGVEPAPPTTGMRERVRAEVMPVNGDAGFVGPKMAPARAPAVQRPEVLPMTHMGNGDVPRMVSPKMAPMRAPVVQTPEVLPITHLGNGDVPRTISPKMAPARGPAVQRPEVLPMTHMGNKDVPRTISPKMAPARGPAVQRPEVLPITHTGNGDIPRTISPKMAPARGPAVQRPEVLPMTHMGNGDVPRTISPKAELIRVRGASAKPAILWVVGGPGSNKAALCQRCVSLRSGWTHFSLGQRLRALADTGGGPASDGALARSAISGGELAPQELVTQLVKTAVTDAGRGTGLLLDGYPRDLEQLEQFQKEFRLSPRMVLLDCSKLQLGRGRRDDSVAAFRRRLEVFRELSLPMLKSLDQQHRLVIVDGDTDSSDVQAEFTRVVEEEMERAEAIAAMPEPVQMPPSPKSDMSSMQQFTHAMSRMGNGLANGALRNGNVGNGALPNGTVENGYIGMANNKVKPMMNNVSKLPTVSQMTHDDVRRLYEQSSGEVMTLNTHM